MLRATGIECSRRLSDVTAIGGRPVPHPGRGRGGAVGGRPSRAATPLPAKASRSLAGGVATAAAMAGLTPSTRSRLPRPARGSPEAVACGAPADLITFGRRPGAPVRTVVAAGQVASTGDGSRRDILDVIR